MSNTPLKFVAATELDGEEALYVNGNKWHSGETLYACDIAEAAKGRPILFSHINVVLPHGDEWPDRLEDVLRYKERD